MSDRDAATEALAEIDALRAEVERLRRVELRLLRLLSIRDETLNRIAQELLSVD